MSTSYYSPTTVVLDVAAADHAGRVLLALANTECDPKRRKEMEDAGNALCALASDTDAIVTDPDLL